MNTEWSPIGEETLTDKSGLKILKICAGGGSIIYNESPKSSPDGKRFVIQTGDCFSVCDLDRMEKYPIESADWLYGNCAFNEYIYFLKHADKNDGIHCFKRFSFNTLEFEDVLEIPGRELPEIGPAPTFSPNQRHAVFVSRFPFGNKLVRLDLTTGEHMVIFEDSSPLRHLHFESVKGDDLLIQHNRTGSYDVNGVEFRGFIGNGTTHFIIASDGTDKRPLCIGEPYTSPASGHSCWIHGTDRIAAAVVWNHNDQNEPGKPADWSCDERYPDVTLFAVGANDEKPIPMVTPNQRFFHVSSSKCGRYYVCNSVPTRKGPTEIVVGNFKSGKSRTAIHDCKCYAGSVWPTSLPQFTADLKHIVYRAKEDENIPGHGGFFVYAAELTDEFLESLE